MKFDFLKRNQLHFSEENYLNYTKRFNFACDIYLVVLLLQVQEDLEQFPKALDAEDFLQASKHVENMVLQRLIVLKLICCALDIIE